MKPELRFKADDGTATLDGLSLVLAPGVLRKTVSSVLASLHRTSIYHGNGYSWEVFQNAGLGGQPCRFALGFHDDKLREISVGVSIPGTELENGWPTRAAIEAEVEFVRAVFSQQFCRSFSEGRVSFQWGSAWSMFDAKAVTATSGVRYAETP
ncbi:hypothetical protein [Pseudorhodoferax aquiterrae]|uniref:hypothetical protein n=1 Tax=Pseudorhodoferax aquiterrae TaxID=747304 RepID=UPI001672E7C8|nr:hypothetical protein [Pseudorhodoferax aquiterrae]